LTTPSACYTVSAKFRQKVLIMYYYLHQAQKLAKLAIENKDQLLFDIAKSNLLMYYKLKKGINIV